MKYVKERTAFGTTIASFQNTKFVLAEVATEVCCCPAVHGPVPAQIERGHASPPPRQQWRSCTGLNCKNRATDRCLQLFGGYGFMTEYPIGPAYADARVTTIYGGTSEIMKTIISKDVLKSRTPLK